MKPAGIYSEIWMKHRLSIQGKLKVAATRQSIQLNSEDFTNVGNRKIYSFNLEFVNGKVSNNIDGSAVARDLAKVLERSDKIKEILEIGHYKINMDKQFCLFIEKK